MDNEAKAIIQERFAKLPADVQRAIQSSNMHEQVTAIGQKHHLHIDQIGELEDEVLLVMLGLTPLAEFADTLAENIVVEKPQATEIATDVSNEIMTPIRESMKKFAEEQTRQTGGGLSVKAAISGMQAPGQSASALGKSVVMPSAASAARTIAPHATPLHPRAHALCALGRSNTCACGYLAQAFAGHTDSCASRRTRYASAKSAPNRSRHASGRDNADRKDGPSTRAHETIIRCGACEPERASEARRVQGRPVSRTYRVANCAKSAINLRYN